jgi:hypothetical protein
MKRLITFLFLAMSSATAVVCFGVEQTWSSGFGSALAGLALPEPAEWMKFLAALLVMGFIARRRGA